LHIGFTAAKARRTLGRCPDQQPINAAEKDPRTFKIDGKPDYCAKNGRYLKCMKPAMPDFSVFELTFPARMLYAVFREKCPEGAQWDESQYRTNQINLPAVQVPIVGRMPRNLAAARSNAVAAKIRESLSATTGLPVARCPAANPVMANNASQEAFEGDRWDKRQRFPVTTSSEGLEFARSSRTMAYDLALQAAFQPSADG
jgi:hypothetical protein